MPLVKSIAEIQDKWTRVVPTRSADYKAGIEKPKADWAEKTGGASANWESGVQGAIASKSFSKGVSAAGTGKWKEKALAKGTIRWAPGVQVAGPDFAKGFGPYRDIIERTDVGPRFAKGDPRNFDRVIKMGTALHAAKVAG